MSCERKAESGIQLLERVSFRPELCNLNERLFTYGLKIGDAVEICGEIGSGKTTLLTQLLAKCLLPKIWNCIEIGGLGAGAIIINTDHHFQILKLVNIMESVLLILNNCTTKHSNLDGATAICLNTETIEKIIKESLANLIVLNCYDRVQLLVTFHSLKTILSNNTNISLIALDSISAYYWQDISVGGVRKMDLFLKKTLKTLQSCVQEHRVVIIYSKQAHFQSKVGFKNESHSKKSLNNIKYRVLLNRMEGKDAEGISFAEVTSLNSTHVIRYRITDKGLVWFM